MEKLVLTGITHPGSIDLVDGLLSIGRNPTNDFRVHDATVSSFHCELLITGTTVLVRDLSSTNGTFIDDEPIHEAILKPGQTLRLGNAQLQVESVPAPEPVRISIPPIKTESVPVQTHLLDGSLACLNHPGVPAIVRCPQCEQAFCGDCVRSLRLKGGQTRLFCPTCSGPCEAILEAPAPKKKQSLLARLTQTIRIRK
jgi:pSer/pThr/pTyr-binding forkhead associated (FHA) protein